MLLVGVALITTFDLETSFGKWFGYQVIAGLGTGVVFQAGLIVIQNAVPPQLIPQATACVQFFQSLGGTIFYAVAQTVFQEGIISGMRRNAPDVDPQAIINSGASNIRQALERSGHSADIVAVLNAYNDGLRNTFYVSLAGAACVMIVSLAFTWKRIKKGDEKQDVKANEEVDQHNLGSEKDAAQEKRKSVEP